MTIPPGGPGLGASARQPPQDGELGRLPSLFTGLALIRGMEESALQKKKGFCFFLSVINGYNQFIYSTETQTSNTRLPVLCYTTMFMVTMSPSYKDVECH